jgi:hypothetical protein
VAAVRATRTLRVPAQTDVTRACDFSDDRSLPLEGERRVYALRDAAFAAALAAANRDRAWTPAARARARWRLAATGAAAVAGLAVGAWLLGLIRVP